MSIINHLQKTREHYQSFTEKARALSAILMVQTNHNVGTQERDRNLATMGAYYLFSNSSSFARFSCDSFLSLSDETTLGLRDLEFESSLLLCRFDLL
jgi:hypothetical protein